MYRVVVNTLGPVATWEFKVETGFQMVPVPRFSDSECIEWQDDQGAIHSFTRANIVRIGYYPIADSKPEGK